MADIVRVPLSPYHKARLANLGVEQAQAQSALDKTTACINEAVSAIVGAHHDVGQLITEGWSIKREGDEIVCTPPAAPA